MPIRKSQRELYPVDWPRIRSEILERAGDRCEWCKKPNGKEVLVDQYGAWRSGLDKRAMVPDEHKPEVWSLVGGVALDGYIERRNHGGWRRVAVVLTIAHLDHDPTNNRFGNLRALCQLCHNRWDAQHRADGIKRRAIAHHARAVATLTILRRSLTITVEDPGPPDRPYQTPTRFDIRGDLLELLNKLEW